LNKLELIVKKIIIGVVCIILGLMLFSLGMFADYLVKFTDTIEHNGVRVSYYVMEKGGYRVFIEILISEGRRDLLKENCSIDIAVLRWAKVKGWNVNRTQFSYLYLPVLLFGRYGSRRLVDALANGTHCFEAIIDFNDTTNYWIVGGDFMELEEWGDRGSVRIGEINIEFDLPIIVSTSPLPESFRESESKLFSANERPPLLKPKEIDIKVSGRTVWIMRNFIWIGVILIIIGLALIIICSISWI